MKKILVLFAALVFLVFTGGCFTSSLYEKSALESRNFVEEVSSFLITQDGKQLIVVGKQHHYIFPANDTLKFILSWSERKRVKASFYNFAINEDQSFSGNYSLTVENSQSLPADTQKLLISKGFTEYNLTQKFTYYSSVNGTRYLADKFEVPATMLFNQKYSINMSESQPSAAATLRRIVLTPLAVAADGALLLGGIPLLLLAIPLGALN